MPPLPRAVCPVCEKSVALRVGGVFREHRVLPHKPVLVGRPRLCAGTGLVAVREETPE